MKAVVPSGDLCAPPKPQMVTTQPPGTWQLALGSLRHMGLSLTLTYDEGTTSID